jgi:hypothetical protein
MGRISTARHAAVTVSTATQTIELIGDPLPAGDRLYGMARDMGRPVARGDLPLEHAFAACITATVAAQRKGELGRYRAADVVSHQRWLVETHAEREQLRRDLITHQIKRTVRPMIAVRKPWGSLMAEAHGVNGAAEFPLTEHEVSKLVEMEVWFALPPAPRMGARHGR